MDDNADYGPGMRGRFEDLFENIRDAILVADPSRRIINCNPAFSDLFGYSLDEIEGQPTEMIYADPSEFESVGEEIRQHIDDENFLFTVDYRTKRGDTFPGETNVFYLRGDDGEPTAFVGVIRDVSERKRREEKQALIGEIGRSIAEAMSFEEGLERALRDITAYTEWQHAEAWVPSADDGTLEFAVGYSGTEELEQFQEASQDVKFAVGEGLPGRVYQHQHLEWIPDVAAVPHERFHRRDLAEDHDVHAALAIPLMHDEAVLAVLTFFLTEERAEDEQLIADISDVVGSLGGLVARKQATDQIRAERDRLETFASIVSHDLRNPLSVAQGRLELAMEDVENEDLRTVSDALDRMDELIDDLLTLARSGGDLGELERVDIREVSERCWDGVVTGNARLTVTASGTIWADATRFRQLLENLLRNAVEHGGESVTVRIEDLPNGFVVADDGPGIPEADIARIFDVGFSSTEQGTGFGLAIVKEIVEAHGWSIAVGESESGGARFEITGVER